MTNLLEDNTERKKDCNLCAEVPLEVGHKTKYGSIIIYKTDNTEDGWFATLSPRTGGNPDEDFTIQLMSNQHVTHFGQLSNHLDVAAAYGKAFAKVSNAMLKVMNNNNPIPSTAETRDEGFAIATYGKCTNWEEKKEHLHIKIYPFRNVLGQPSPVDSSFGRKETHSDGEGNQFIKMEPVIKKDIPKDRFSTIAKQLITLLKE